MKTPKILSALPAIKGYFESVLQQVFSSADLEHIFTQQRESWKAPNSFTGRKFIAFLEEHSVIESARFEFPSRAALRFWRGACDNLELAQSFGPKGYLSHRSAMEAHGLIERDLQEYYVNEEQKPKPPSSGRLEQNRIDTAFALRARISNNRAKLDGHSFCILNGMKTNGLGIIDYERPQRKTLRTTSIERTLIDIVVRPFYAGGVSDVLGAYRLADGKFSIDQMANLLNELNFTYPYHQAIGFYLDRSGVYSASDMAYFKEMGLAFDFYLTNQMEPANYSQEWHIYYPTDIDNL